MNSYLWIEIEDSLSSQTGSKGNVMPLHVSVSQIFKVVSPDTLMRVWSQYGFAIIQAPQALNTNSFPRIQQIPV